jgi:hypothetical protein
MIVETASETVTEPTATGSTTRVVWPLIPSLVAMMFVDPGATAVTMPVAASTVATAGLLELQLTERPARRLLLASRVTAVALVDVPAIIGDPGLSVTVTEATGTGVTTSAAWPLIPSLVATTFAEPGATAVTTPVEASTVATAGLLDVHTIDRPASTLLLASRVTAVAFAVAPAITVEALSVTVTEATGTGMTVRGAWPVIPSLVAMMFALPAATALTTPVDASTVATD